MNKNFPTDFTLAVNAEVRSWMGRRGVTQRQLSEKTGISKSKMSRILGTEEQSMDTDELDGICQALGVSPERIVEDAARSLEQSSYGLAAKHDPGVGADINDEDYF